MDVFQVVKALRIQKPGSVLTVVSISNLYVHDQHELPVDLQASFIQLYRLQETTLYSGNIKLVPIVLLINRSYNQYSLFCIQFMTVGLTSQLLSFTAGTVSFHI